MHCFLHIGIEKTGTTLIQDFLHINLSLLEEKLGFGYLKSAGLPSNRWLVVAAYEIDRRDSWTDYKNVIDNSSMLALRKEIVDSIKTELKSRKINTLVISSEHIQSRLTKLSEIERLKNILIEIGVTSISVIVYLRDPIELAGSLYSTSVKSGSMNSIPGHPNNFNYAHVCDHRKTLLNFSKVFGINNLIVKIFDRAILKNNSILDDFLSILNISDKSIFLKPSTENKSLSNLGTELLYRINKFAPNLPNNINYGKRQGILIAFEKYFTNKPYLMPLSLYHSYGENFKDSNEWVRVNFFKDKDDLFSKKKLPELDLKEKSNTHLSRIVDLIADAWILRGETNQ